MVDIDPYDPALKYPQEWGRQSRLGALKCWRDGDKTRAIYWMKDHEWKVFLGVELLTTNDVTKDLMSQVEWALSDKENTFTALDRCEGGLLYSKHGNEHINQDYWEKSLRWSHRILTKQQEERGMFWMAKTRRFTYFEWLGGTDLTNAEAFALLAKFAYLIGAKATGKGMRQVNRDIAAIRQRRVHRSTAWLVLHRAGIHEKIIHKAIFQQAGLF